MPADQFEKDFGYLMPFIDKIAAATAGVSNPSARAELSGLIADEKQRWARIRQLLSGAASESTSARKDQPVPERTRPPIDESITGATVREGPQFTVGSLRPSKN